MCTGTGTVYGRTGTVYARTGVCPCTGKPGKTVPTLTPTVFDFSVFQRCKMNKYETEVLNPEILIDRIQIGKDQKLFANLFSITIEIKQKKKL